MKVREFLRTANVNQLCDFIHTLVWGCECCGDCPLTEISDLNIDTIYYSCDHDCIMKFLNSEMKKGWNK